MRIFKGQQERVKKPNFIFETVLSCLQCKNYLNLQFPLTPQLPDIENFIFICLRQLPTLNSTIIASETEREREVKKMLR